MKLPPLEVWSPFPPQPSGVADYVAEQLGTLSHSFSLTLISEDSQGLDPDLGTRYRVATPAQSDSRTLRVYHVGNSPLHGFIYREAIRTPGVVVLHEWNLHELHLGFAVTAGDFGPYRRTMRREHGGRGSVAAETIASALGGQNWTGLFPLNLEILERSLAVVCLAGSTAARVAARSPGTPLLHIPHHALLHARATDRSAALKALGLRGRRVVLVPGLGTSAKEYGVVQAAVDALRPRIRNLSLVTVGGARSEAQPSGADRDLGRVDLLTLGDALVAAEVVIALRFPSRGEASGVVMRSLAAGRALVVSTGSTADEDLPAGVVARISPGAQEVRELAAVLEFLLKDDEARLRLECLSLATAATRGVEPLTERLSDFLREVMKQRSVLEEQMSTREKHASKLRAPIRDEVEAMAASLGLAHLPTNVFERLAGL